MSPVELRERILDAVLHGQSFLNLRAIVRDYAAGGGTYREAGDVLEALRQEVGEDNETLLDVLDVVCGCCAPELRLWSDAVYK